MYTTDKYVVNTPKVWNFATKICKIFNKTYTSFKTSSPWLENCRCSNRIEERSATTRQFDRGISHTNLKFRRALRTKWNLPFKFLQVSRLLVSPLHWRISFWTLMTKLSKHQPLASMLTRVAKSTASPRLSLARWKTLSNLVNALPPLIDTMTELSPQGWHGKKHCIISLRRQGLIIDNSYNAGLVRLKHFTSSQGVEGLRTEY